MLSEEVARVLAFAEQVVETLGLLSAAWKRTVVPIVAVVLIFMAFTTAFIQESLGTSVESTLPRLSFFGDVATLVLAIDVISRLFGL
jgi:hypothetical protein